MMDRTNERRLTQTRQAFDALAMEYDRSEERNELLLRLRCQVLRVLLDTFPAGSRLLDLGCGTGLDASYLAERGRRIVAVDLSPAMVARARERAVQLGFEHMVETRVLPIEQIDSLRGEPFDGIYSDRGAFNCVDGLGGVAGQCAALLEPGGRLVTTVIGRVCPWEGIYYAAHRDWSRATLRSRRGFVPVSLQRSTVPTRYFTPREFYSSFEAGFRLERYRALGVFLPPTYLAPLCRRHRTAGRLAARLDDVLGAAPGIRNIGDLFLMVLVRRE